MKIMGNRVYFDTTTGEVIVLTGQMKGFFTPPSVELDIKTYKALSERNRNTFDVIELEYGQYVQDFAECNGYRVNPETKELEFSYPNPNEEEPQEPVYQKPLSEQIKELESGLLEMSS